MDPKEIGKEFVKEMEKKLGKRLIYFFFGSVRRGEYIEGKSDIDIVILAKNDLIYPKEWVKILKATKGRKPVIDVCIIPKAEVQIMIKEKFIKGKSIQENDFHEPVEIR